LKAGIVLYRRVPGSLMGEWSDDDIAGKLANETVRDVDDGAVTGDWPVEILLPDGTLVFSGRLSSTSFGDCLKLKWEGISPQRKGTARFEGIGRAVQDDLIVASFEKVEQA